MTTHPKGSIGWRQRDNARTALRMRRRRKNGRIVHLSIGARLSESTDRQPEICAAGDPDRHAHCASYRLCLDDASQAQTDGRLDPAECTWCCGADCPGRATVEPIEREFRRSAESELIPSRVERWR